MKKLAEPLPAAYGPRVRAILGATSSITREKIKMAVRSILLKREST
jgi:hypothetical protein